MGCVPSKSINQNPPASRQAAAASGASLEVPFSLIFLSIAALPLMPWSTYSGASASRRYPCLHREKVYLEAEGGVGKVSDLFAFMISMCVATSL